MGMTNYGLEYSLVKEINPDWSTYDKVIASTHISRFGVIICDTLGCPIDNEWDLWEIKNKERLA